MFKEICKKNYKKIQRNLLNKCIEKFTKKNDKKACES